MRENCRFITFKWTWFKAILMVGNELKNVPLWAKTKMKLGGFSSIEKFHSLEIIRVDNALFAPLVRETTFLRKPLRLWVVDGTVIVPASDVLIETTTFIKGKLHHWKFRTGANIFCYDHRYQWNFFFNLCNNTRTCFSAYRKKWQLCLQRNVCFSLILFILSISKTLSIPKKTFWGQRISHPFDALIA